MQRGKKFIAVVILILISIIWGVFEIGLVYAQSPIVENFLTSVTPPPPNFTLTSSLQPTNTPIPPTNTNTTSPTLTNTPTPGYTFTALPTKPFSPEANVDNSTSMIWGILGTLIGGFVVWFFSLPFKKLKLWSDNIFDPNPSNKIKAELPGWLITGDFAQAVNNLRPITDNNKPAQKTAIEEWTKFKYPSADNQTITFEKTKDIIKFIIERDYSGITDEKNIKSFLYVYNNDSRLREILSEGNHTYSQKLLTEVDNKLNINIKINKTIINWWGEYINKRTSKDEFAPPYFPIYCEDDFKFSIDTIDEKPIIEIKKKVLGAIKKESNESSNSVLVGFRKGGGKSLFATSVHKDLLIKHVDGEYLFPVYVKIDDDLENVEDKIIKGIFENSIMYFCFRPDTFLNHRDVDGYIKLFKKQELNPTDITERFSHCITPEDKTYTNIKEINKVIKELMEKYQDTSTVINFERACLLIPEYRRKLVLIMDYGENTTDTFITDTVNFLDNKKNISSIHCFTDNTLNKQHYKVVINHEDIKNIIYKRLGGKEKGYGYAWSLKDELDYDLSDNRIKKIIDIYLDNKWLFRSSNGSPAKVLINAHTIKKNFKNLSEKDMIWMLHIPEEICGSRKQELSKCKFTKSNMLFNNIEDLRLLAFFECLYGDSIKLSHYTLDRTWVHTPRTDIINAVVNKTSSTNLNNPLYEENREMGKCIIIDSNTDIIKDGYTIVVILEWVPGNSDPIDDIKNFYNIKND